MNLYPILASMESLAEDKGMLTLVVTICGILIVFVALILLILVIGLFGKVTANAGSKSKPRAKKEKASQVSGTAAPAISAAPAPAARSAASAVSAPAAVSSNGIPDEIIAVIAAAVAAMDDGSYVIRSVRRSQEGRPAWSMAGIYENTRPF